MANLYEIAQDLIDTLDYEVDTETGEVLEGEDLKKRIDELQMTLTDKIDNIGAYIKNLESDVESFKIEQKKLMERRKVAENKITRLRNYLDKFIRLQFTNEDGEVDTEKLKKYKFETPRTKISYRKSDKIVITDIDSVPQEFIKEHKITEDDIMSSEIKKLIKSGTNVDYANIVENTNLSVK